MDIFFWVVMTGFVTYVSFFQKEDADFKPGMIARIISFVVMMTIVTLASLLDLAFPTAPVPKDTMMTWLLGGVVFMLKLIYDELKIMRMLAQISERRISKAEERAGKLSRGED